MPCFVKKIVRKLEKISAENLVLHFSGNAFALRIEAIALKL
jgi:hypothetical protein